MTGRNAGELRLVHVPNGRVNPDDIIKLRPAAGDIEDRYLRPGGVTFHIGVGGGRDSFAVHHHHVLGADGDEMLDPDAGRVVVKKDERFLACSCINAGLCVGRKPRIQSCSGNYCRIMTAHD